MENTKQLRAALYIRCSSEEQMKGFGPALQLEDTRKAAIERDGCLVKDEHIVDDSKSGKNDDRPGWKRLMEMAKRKEFDVIYFWKLDRMMRDELSFFVNQDILEKLGIRLRFATENLEDPFTRSIFVAVAAEERRKIKERTYGGRMQALKKGRWMASAPYGYSLDKKTGGLKINPGEAENLKLLFELFVDDRLSLQSLAKKAQERKIPTRYDIRKKKKPNYGPYFWSLGQLGRLLRRDYYATGTAQFCKYKRPRGGKAELRPQKDWIELSITPIISVDLFEKAQRQIKKNGIYARRRTKRSYLFARKLICSDCGRRPIAQCQPKGERKMYRGDTWREERCPECRYFAEKKLDVPIWNAIYDFFQDPKYFLDILELSRNKDSVVEEIQAEGRRLKELEKEIDKEEKKLLEYDLKGLYSGKVIAEQKKELEDKRQSIVQQGRELQKKKLMEEQRALSISSARDLFQQIKDILENPTYSLKQILYGKLVEKIVISRQKAEVWMNIPSASAIPYFMMDFRGGEFLSPTPYKKRHAPRRQPL